MAPRPLPDLGRAWGRPAWVGSATDEIKDLRVDLAHRSVQSIAQVTADRFRGLNSRGVAIRQEGETWAVTLTGSFGERPPGELADFQAFARTLPTQGVADLATH